MGFVQTMATSPIANRLFTQTSSRQKGRPITKGTDSNARVVFINDLGDGLRLANTELLPYEYRDGYFCMKLIQGVLSVEIMEESYRDMVDSFREEMRMLWKNYALEDDNNLTYKAQELKRILLSKIKTVL